MCSLKTSINLCTHFMIDLIGGRFLQEEKVAITIEEAITIGRFHSRGRYLCKFIATKESVFSQERSSTPTGLVWDTNMAAVSLFWDTNMAAVTSCENTLLLSSSPSSSF